MWRDVTGRFPLRLPALRVNLVAGITVAIVALPLALGFGVTSGAGAASGLATAIVAGALAGVFGGSKYQVSGPTGAMVVVLVPIVATVGVAGLLPIGLLAGALIVALGLLRLGKWVEKVPWSVMEGFTLGIALVIALQQIPLIFEVPRAEGTEALAVAFRTIESAVAEGIHWWSLAVVAVTLVVKALWSVFRGRFAWSRHLPASAVAVVVMTSVVWLGNIPVQTIGALPATDVFRLSLTWPDLPWFTLVWSAVVVALLGAIESLLSARVADSMVHRRDGGLDGPYQPNRELVGQGIATIGSALMGGMPATGAIARTGVNVNAGATSRLATIVHAVTLVVFVFLLASLVAEVPLAVLAGVLLGTSWRIANPRSIREALQTTTVERVGYLTTAIAVLAIDLLWGTLIGIVVHAIASRWQERRNRP